MIKAAPFGREAGFSMIEVLVTLVILLFGLLGLVGLQSRAQVAETESYQRTQALVLLRDMADRISANRVNSDSYLTPTSAPLGQASTKDCSAPATLADTDLCQWDAALKGASEASGTCNLSTGANCVGAMLGARGCVTDVTPVSATTKQYLIEVVWQGLATSASPPTSVVCGSGSYGAETQRRAVTTVVEIGNLDLP
jgi:type IV pilus assembly protein PilV